MNGVTFFETIKVENGKINNLDLHIKRSSETILRHYGIIYAIPFEQLLEEYYLKEHSHKEYSLQNGIFKFRVVYSSRVLKHTLTPYSPQTLKTLKVVEYNGIEYGYKYENRSRIESLRALRGACDDILIVKNGYATDTSYGNILFKLKNDKNLYTPTTFLLKGTKREFMLSKGLISERELRIENISECELFYMINAMVEPTPVTVIL
ncbi:MAG: aminotransferase class IV [Bacteroidales bacterium]|nr:aminotransferase class IV [Bacteroidales bacterium]